MRLAGDSTFTQRQTGAIVNMELTRLKVDQFAHYVPLVEPNQAGYNFKVSTAFLPTTISRAGGSGMNAVGVNINEVSKSEDFTATVRERNQPIGSSNYKYITVPGFSCEWELGEIDESVGFFDVSCSVKAPSFLFKNKGSYTKSWTMEIDPSASIQLVGKGISSILVKDDATHSYAQFVAKQAVKILRSSAPEKVRLTFYLEIDPKNIDLTASWANYNFVAEVVVCLVAHRLTRLALVD